MLTYPKSTMRVWRIPMHLSSDHVTLMPGKFYLPPNFPQSDLERRADSRWALPQIFTRAKERPRITNAHPTGDGSPPYNFFQRGSKIASPKNF